MSLQKDPLSNISKTKSYIALLAFMLFSILMLVNSEKTRNVYWIILALIGMVLLHEAGHLIAAKLTNMKATEYFAGFGPKLWSFKKGETEYGIKAIPLGGYVKIIGMSDREEVPEEDESRTYRQASTWRKLVVISAGVFANFLTAFVLLFSLFFFHGVEDAKISKNEIAKVESKSPASSAGLKPGDKIISINGNKIDSFEEVSKIITSSKGEEISMTIDHSGKTEEIALKAEKVDGKYLIGIVANVDLYQRKLGFVDSAEASAKSIKNVITMSYKGFAKLFTPNEIKQYSKTVASGDTTQVERPSSIVGIVDTGAEVAKNGWPDFVMFVALINIAIGALNALPLLPLDGGHAVIAIYEGVASFIARKRVKVSYNFMVSVSSAVLVVLMLLFFSSTYLDIKTIFVR